MKSTQNKKYNPVQVRNPTSDYHVVKILPGQKIVLTLDADVYDNPKIESKNKYLFLSPVTKTEKSYSCNIYHATSVHNWSEYSRTQLGEIVICSDANIAKLQIILDTTNDFKQKNITVVNPVSADLRLKPHDIVEVALYDYSFLSGSDSWDWHWLPNFGSLEIEELGRKEISHYVWNNCYGCIDEDDPDYQYSSCLRTESPENNASFRQHHFWFRFSREVLGLLNKGTSLAGSLYFTGVPCKWTKNVSTYVVRKSVSLHVDFDYKYRNDILETLSIERKSNCAPPSKNLRLSKKTFPKCQRRYKPSCKSRRQIELFKKDVTITALQVNSLADGCNVLPSFMSREEFYNYNNWDYDKIMWEDE